MSGKLIVFGDGHTVVNAGAYEDENTPLGLPDVDRDFQNGGPGGGSSHQHLRFAAPAQWHQQTVAYNSMSTESQPAQHRHEHRVVDTRAQVTCGLPMMMHSQPVSQLQIPAFIPPLGSEPELLNKDEIDGMYVGGTAELFRCSVTPVLGIDSCRFAVKMQRRWLAKISACILCLVGTCTRMVHLATIQVVKRGERKNLPRNNLKLANCNPGNTQVHPSGRQWCMQATLLLLPTSD